MVTGKRVMSSMGDEAAGNPPLAREADGSLRYVMYIIAFDRLNPPWTLPGEVFDLVDDPHDVCVSIQGHQLTLFQSSNEVRIPEAMIRAAFQRAR